MPPINIGFCPITSQSSLASDFGKQRSSVSQIETTLMKERQQTVTAGFHSLLYEDIGYVAKI